MEILIQPKPHLVKRETEAAQLLEGLVSFCAQHGPPHCYAGWPRETVESYLLFHMQQKTFAYIQASGVVLGCGIIWQGDEREIRGRIRAGLNTFAWQPTDPAGDCLFLEEFICRQPGVVRALLRHFKQRFPGWRALTVMTLKKGRLKVYA